MVRRPAGLLGSIGAASQPRRSAISTFTLKSGTAIFGYAIFFGFAQQALTGLIDHRASSLAKEKARMTTVKGAIVEAWGVGVKAVSAIPSAQQVAVPRIT